MSHQEDDGNEVKSWTQQDFGLDRRLIKVRMFMCYECIYMAYWHILHIFVRHFPNLDL